jgi:hypothetical protein
LDERIKNLSLFIRNAVMCCQWNPCHGILPRVDLLYVSQSPIGVRS